MLILLVLGGCQHTRVVRPVTADVVADDADGEIEFWHTLSTRPLTSNDDAFHGLLIYIDGHDPHRDYASRVAALRSRGLLPANFDRPADEAVSRGTLAVGIAKTLKIRGGVIMRLVGAQPRYATRELEYLQLYPASSPNQTFSGAEFVGIMGRLDDYRRGGDPADLPADELPAATTTQKSER